MNLGCIDVHTSYQGFLPTIHVGAACFDSSVGYACCEDWPVACVLPPFCVRPTGQSAPPGIYGKHCCRLCAAASTSSGSLFPLNQDRDSKLKLQAPAYALPPRNRISHDLIPVAHKHTFCPVGAGRVHFGDRSCMAGVSNNSCGSDRPTVAICSALKLHNGAGSAAPMVTE